MVIPTAVLKRLSWNGEESTNEPFTCYNSLHLLKSLSILQIDDFGGGGGICLWSVGLPVTPALFKTQEASSKCGLSPRSINITRKLIGSKETQTPPQSESALLMRYPLKF